MMNPRTMITHLMLLLGLLSATTEALKHDFKTKNDDRHLIGPIGFPFGFAGGGEFNLTVYDFKLSLGSKIDQTSGGAAGDGYIPDGLRDLRKKKAWKNAAAKLEAALGKVEGVGFLLKKFKDEADFNKYLAHYEANDDLCIFSEFLKEKDDDLLAVEDFGELIDGEAGENGIFMNMTDRARTWRPATPNISYSFNKTEAGYYFLMYQLCPKPKEVSILSSFEMNFDFSNYSFKHRSYLTVGEMVLPHVFLYFSLLYGICTFLWFSNMQLIQDGHTGHFSNPTGGQPVIYPIHKLMGALLVLKFLSLFFESIRYHYLRVVGHAELWTGVFYFFAFIKGSFLFLILLLLGSGWSFVKPFLNDREKTMFFAVLILQVINNIALVVLTGETEGERAFDRWTAILHLVDILCCCAVLIPIVWHVNALEKNMEQSNGDHNDLDGEDDADEVVPEDEVDEDTSPRHVNGRLLNKLKLFRSFYLLVVIYIYVTRIVVYLLATQLDYRHTWVRPFVVETVTLAFYIMVGMQFRPMGENPYLSIRRNEDLNGAINAVELELNTRTPPP